MDLDLQPLVRALTEAARAAFTEAREARPDERFFAYALSTVDDANFVGAGANSHENRAAIAAANDVEDGTPDAEYYAWNPCEWGELEYLGAASFEPAEVLLAQLYQATPDERFQHLAEGVRASMQGALAALDEEGFFGRGQARREVTLFCTVYDSERAAGFEDRSAEALNPEVVYARFRERYASTEATRAAEGAARAARRSLVADRDPEAQAEVFLGDIEALLENPCEDPIAAMQAEQSCLENLRVLGEDAVLPILGFVEAQLAAPTHAHHAACASLLALVRELGLATQEVHEALARLLELSCRLNEGRERWHITPVHLAKTLGALFEGYPGASMGSGNKLYLHERFLAKAAKLSARRAS